MASVRFVSVVITAHREGLLLLPTIQSAVESANSAIEKHNISVEYIMFLDRPDKETRAIAEQLPARVFEGDFGDPGATRLAAISKAETEYVALLDGDDLWSENWLTEALFALENTELTERDRTVIHPEYNLIFGGHSLLVRQGDPTDPLFHLSYFRSSNYWDALCLCHRQIFTDIPYMPNDPAQGIAHEDYHWMAATILAGVKHKIVANTIHFKRRRSESVSAKADEKRARPHFTSLDFYDYYVQV